jgi:predicted lipid-binding transport protein (Tim44 family)
VETHVSATEHAARLQSRIAAIAQAAEEAAAAVEALSADPAIGDAAYWLPGLRQALDRIQLECADLQFGARELRKALPSASALQPRLI